MCEEREVIPITSLFETEKRARMKRILNAEMDGRRPLERPRTRWKDQFHRHLESSGLALEQAAEEARDGTTWKNIVLALSYNNAAGR